MYTLTYPITVKKDGESFLIKFLDFPEAITSCYDKSEIIQQASYCLDTAIAARIKHKEEIPSPSKKGRLKVAPSTLMAAKTILYIEMRRQHIRKAELAKKLKMDKKQIDRILEPWHKSTISQVEKALHAIGISLVLNAQNL